MISDEQLRPCLARRWRMPDALVTPHHGGMNSGAFDGGLAAGVLDADPNAPAEARSAAAALVAAACPPAAG